MSAQVILVTGSRALADDPAATRWARKILARAAGIDVTEYVWGAT